MNMKKKNLIFVAILVVVIIGIVYGVASSNQNANIENNSEAESYFPEEMDIESDTEAEENSTEETTVENDIEENLLNETEEEEIVSAESFNSRLNGYWGKGLDGAEVNRMIDLLISNAEKYSGKAEYLPTVRLVNSDFVVEGQDEAAQNGENYIEKLTQLKSRIDESRGYSTEMSYADSGLINEIWIY